MKSRLTGIDGKILQIDEPEYEPSFVWASFFIVKRQGAARLIRDLLEKIDVINWNAAEPIEHPSIENFTRQRYTYIMFWFDADEMEDYADKIWMSAMQLVSLRGEDSVELLSPNKFIARDAKAFIKLVNSGLKASCIDYVRAIIDPKK